MKKLQLYKIINEEIKKILKSNYWYDGIKENKTINEMWEDRLRNVYDDDFEQFSSYDNVYNISKRLGFDSPEKAWEENPVIQGSTNPKDLKVVREDADDSTEKIIVNGKTYNAKVFFDDDSANEFMEKNPNWGVIKVDNNKIYVSKFNKKLKETSSTGGVAGYLTPLAFTGQKGVSKKQKQIANQLGYHLVDDNLKKENKKDLNEGLDTYYFKDDSLTSEQKLGLAMRQVRNNLQEVEKLVKKSIKMKNEDNIDSTKVGKRTYSALRRINEKVVRLMVSLNDLK